MPTVIGPALRVVRPPSFAPPVAAGWSGAIGIESASLGPNAKIIHFVRHAQGYHNIDPSIMKQPAGLDARLTDEGEAQCAQLAQTAAELRPQLIVVSPLTRTMQTALLSFSIQLKQQGVPLVALESVRETVNYLCDARRPLSAIVSQMAEAGVAVDTSAGCEHEHDELWAAYERKHGTQAAFKAHRESADMPGLAARARSAFAWLAARPEREIIIVSHSAFYWNVLNMARLGRRAGVAPIADYGDDFELEAWLSTRFENCEMRSVVCEFPPT